MKNRVLCVTLAAAIAVALPAVAGEAREFSGCYDWNNGGSGPLEVTFRPKAPSVWIVEFRFEFDGRKETWKGSAEGTLEGGALTGRVNAGGGSRVFVFAGSFQDGTFGGTHAELKREKEYPSGTLTFRP